MSVLLVLLSVSATAVAQLLLKSGVSKVLSLDLPPGGAPFLLAIACSPLVIGGMAVFGFGVLSWLTVLARMDVSRAYPFVSLGIVLTVLGGHFLFGETLHPTRIAGMTFIVLGVLLVAIK